MRISKVMEEPLALSDSHINAILRFDVYNEGHLTADSLYVILSEEKQNQKEKYSFQRERISRYIPEGLPDSKVESYIIEALEYYARVQQRKANVRKNGAR